MPSARLVFGRLGLKPVFADVEAPPVGERQYATTRALPYREFFGIHDSIVICESVILVDLPHPY